MRFLGLFSQMLQASLLNLANETSVLEYTDNQFNETHLNLVLNLRNVNGTTWVFSEHISKDSWEEYNRWISEKIADKKQSREFAEKRSGTDGWDFGQYKWDDATISLTNGTIPLSPTDKPL